MKCSNTGDYKYLYKAKKYDSLTASIDMAMIWGDIILEYNELAGTLESKTRFHKSVYLNQLINLYITVKAIINCLMIVDPEKDPDAKTYIADLERVGYKVDLSSPLKYEASLRVIDKRSNHLITRIKSLRNEVRPEEERIETHFDELMAGVQSYGFNVSDDITVARYIYIQKIAKKRAESGSNKAK